MAIHGFSQMAFVVTSVLGTFQGAAKLPKPLRQHSPECRVGCREVKGGQVGSKGVKRGQRKTGPNPKKKIPMGPVPTLRKSYTWDQSQP